MATTGSCMCGEIAYEFTGKPEVTALCHCKDCQKWSGGGNTSNVVVPRTAFKVTKGTPKQWPTIGDSGKKNEHFFCGNCGSSLYTELEVMPDSTCVKAGGLDGGAADIPIAVEFYTKDRTGFCAPVKDAQQVKVFG